MSGGVQFPPITADWPCSQRSCTYKAVRLTFIWLPHSYFARHADTTSAMRIAFEALLSPDRISLYHIQHIPFFTNSASYATLGHIARGLAVLPCILTLTLCSPASRPASTSVLALRLQSTQHQYETPSFTVALAPHLFRFSSSSVVGAVPLLPFSGRVEEAEGSLSVLTFSMRCLSKALKPLSSWYLLLHRVR
jgi:hypothetical protein